MEYSRELRASSSVDENFVCKKSCQYLLHFHLTFGKRQVMTCRYTTDYK